MDTLFFFGYELVSAFIPWSLAFMVLKRIKPYDTKEQKAGGTILLTIFIIYLVGVYHYTDAGTVFDKDIALPDHGVAMQLVIDALTDKEVQEQAELRAQYLKASVMG